MKKIYALALSGLFALSACSSTSSNSSFEEPNIMPTHILSVSPYHNSYYADENGIFGTGRGEYCEVVTAPADCSNTYNSFEQTTSPGMVIQIANGNFHTVVLLEDGTVRVAGNRTRGQLGIDSGNDDIDTWSLPEFDGTGPAKVVQVAAGHYNTILLDNEGHLWGTGYYSNGQLGMPYTMGDPLFINTFHQLDTPADVEFTFISMGYDQLLAIDTDGNIWGTGGNRSNSVTSGQLGAGYLKDENDIDADSFGFIQVTTGTRFIKVSGGGAGAGNGTDAFNGARHSLALDSDGYIWATGSNDDGQLGTGDNTLRVQFTRLAKPSGVSRFIDIAAGGRHSAAVDNAGNMWTTGDNSNYALALGDVLNVNEFTKVPLPDNSDYITEISAGAIHTMAVDNDGTVWTAGTNEYGQLGLGHTIGVNYFAKTLSHFDGETVISAASLTGPGVENPVLPYSAPEAEVVRVGFVGNSLTFTNDIPARLREIAEANGKSVETLVQAISGDRLNNQFNVKDWAAFRVLSYYRPHYILFQDQTGITNTSNPSQIQVLSAWTNLARGTESFAGSPVEPVLYQTWHNRNSCNAYVTNADTLGIKVAPVGQAFNQYKTGSNTCPANSATNAWNDLTKPEDYHPTMPGAYLSALTIYSTLFNITSTDQIRMPEVPAVDVKDNIAGDSPRMIWDDLVAAAVTAVSKTPQTQNIYQPIATNPAMEAVTLSTTAQSITLDNTGSSIINMRMPAHGTLEMTSLTSRKYYWFLQESNGRFIGRTVPGEAGDLNYSLELDFFSFGDRISGEIPYADGIIPAGNYKLYIIRDTTDHVADRDAVQIKYIPAP